jgi:hypothetical protein
MQRLATVLAALLFLSSTAYGHQLPKVVYLASCQDARLDRHRDGLSRFFSLQFSGLVGSLPLEECVHGQASPSR